MYKFHYKCIGTKYDSSAKFSLTDTGSLVYEIETDNVYEDFYKQNNNLFDFKDYPEDSNLFDPVNKKLKDEVKGKIISEFFCIKVKDIFFSYRG